MYRINLLYHVKEILVHPSVACKFWMESDGKLLFIADAYDMSFHGGEGIYAFCRAFYIWSAYEFHGKVADALDGSFCLVETP